MFNLLADSNWNRKRFISRFIQSKSKESFKNIIEKYTYTISIENCTICIDTQALALS